MERIKGDPGMGESKTGDLQGFQVHKFTFRKQRLLIAYRATESDMLFYTIGPHENFYRELKRYLKGSEEK